MPTWVRSRKLDPYSRQLIGLSEKVVIGTLEACFGALFCKTGTRLMFRRVGGLTSVYDESLSVCAWPCDHVMIESHGNINLTEADLGVFSMFGRTGAPTRISYCICPQISGVITKEAILHCRARRRSKWN